ncbi:MAG: isocitrate lyase/PEP mutase family protein [Bacillota bacterium]
MKKTKRLRELLNSGKMTLSACGYDALSMRLIELAGFEMAGTTGFGIHGSMLGTPDAGLIALNESVERLGKMAEAVDIPILADAESGYGNAINAMRMVREHEKCGVAGVFFEDQKIPPNCPAYKETQLISMDEMAGKLEAACAARIDPDFVITARTDAIEFDETVKRLGAYVEAGADSILLIPQRLEVLEKIPSLIKVPVSVPFESASRVYPGITVSDLEKLGYLSVSFTFIALFASVKNTLDVLRKVREDGTILNVLDKMISVEEYFKIVDADKYLEREKKYLRG